MLSQNKQDYQQIRIMLPIYNSKFGISMSQVAPLLKMIMLGNPETGKSCIVHRFAQDTFQSNYLATIGVQFSTKRIPVFGNQVKLQIWDTAGQQTFKAMTAAYFKGAHGILLTYDVGNRNSFEAIRNVWLEEIKKHANGSVVTLLIGNKSDLHEAREVSYEEGRDLANQLEIDFEEVSAKENLNLEAAFTKLAQKCIAKIEK